MKKRKNRIGDVARRKKMSKDDYTKQLKEKSIANGKIIRENIGSLGWETI